MTLSQKQQKDLFKSVIKRVGSSTPTLAQARRRGVQSGVLGVLFLEGIIILVITLLKLVGLWG